MPSSLALAIPGLFDLPPASLRDASAQAPALRGLLALAAAACAVDDNLWGWLCGELDVVRQQDWPLAPIWARAEGIDVDDAYWLVAQPVMLELRRDDVRLIDTAPALDSAESGALLETLNHHFRDDGVTFVASRPGRWFVRAGVAPALMTTPPLSLRGRTLRQHLPTGADAGRWRRWQNEIQMLLFEHTINLKREARDAPPVNSVWIWGGGKLPAPGGAVGVTVFADDADVRALSAFAGAAVEPLAAFQAASGAGARKTLAVATGDEPVGRIDTLLAAPARRAFAAGELTSLTLVLGGSDGLASLTCERPSSWRRLIGDRTPLELDDLVARWRAAPGEVD